MVPDVQSIREYQNFPNSYLLFTKVSMHLSISHSLCSTVFSLCRRSSRSPIMLSILLVMCHIIGRAGVVVQTALFFSIFIYTYIRSTVRRALNLLRASFSPIFQYFSAVNVTRVSFSPGTGSLSIKGFELRCLSKSPSSPTHSQPSSLLEQQTRNPPRVRLRPLFGKIEKALLHVGQGLPFFFTTRSIHTLQKLLPQHVTCCGWRNTCRQTGHSH